MFFFFKKRIMLHLEGWNHMLQLRAHFPYRSISLFIDIANDSVTDPVICSRRRRDNPSVMTHLCMRGHVFHADVISAS